MLMMMTAEKMKMAATFRSKYEIIVGHGGSTFVRYMRSVEKQGNYGVYY
jgi:hypothetical protein